MSGLKCPLTADIVARNPQLTLAAVHESDHVPHTFRSDEAIGWAMSRWAVDMRQALVAFMFSRGLILAVLSLSAATTTFEIPAIEGRNLNPRTEVSANVVRSGLARVLGSADAGWYLRIAESGYDAPSSDPDTPRNWVFFPLFPLLVRALTTLGLPPLVAGCLISNVAFLAAMCAIVFIARALGFSEEVRVRLSWLIALFPMSYFFSAPFTESMFLALSAAAFLVLTRGHPLTASALMGLASATRPTGLLIVPGFALAVLRSEQTTRRSMILTLALAPAGALMFAVYQWYVLGDALAFVHNQSAWGRSKRSIGELIGSLLVLPFPAMEPWSFTLLHLVVLAAAAWASVHHLKQNRPELALVLAVPLVAALSTGELLSLTRFTMALFPFHLAIAERIRSSSAERMVLAVYAALLGIMTSLYGQHVTSAMT